MRPLPGPERFKLIAPVLEAALELPEESRRAFLDRACAGDGELRAEVEDLLSADSDAGAFLDAPVDLAAVSGPPGNAEKDPDRLSGTTIGSYRLVREIGRGGMGVVYEAEQQSPRRPVALKVILGGRHVDAVTVRMFQREADSLARLKHPSIAAIYESGRTDEGQHFFAMELVAGRSLSDYLDDVRAPASRADVRRRLALFRKIAAAVAYAHQRGVIHRDLKPSNILVSDPPRSGLSGRETDSTSVGPEDGGDPPDVKILDFGLARITDAGGDAATALTEIGRIQGTLSYMSPEQVRGRRDEVDVRTDVYSLGVVLYRMMTGRLPYELAGVDFPEAARIVCEQAPRPPAAAGPKGMVDRDLSIILLKALEKVADRRYPSVAALDDDVQRFLEGRPIVARSPSSAYQLRKLVARHKAPFAAGVAVLLVLAGSTVVTTVQARRIARERDRANREAQTALRVSEFLTDLFKVSDPSEAKGNAVTAREILDKGVEKIGKGLADEPEVLSRLLLTMGRVYIGLGLFREAGPVLEKSVETRRRLFGEDHPETLSAIQSLAFLYAETGRTSDAEKLYLRLLETRRRIQGEDHPMTIGSISGLAEACAGQGRYAEAETLYREALGKERRVLGEDHPYTLETMNQLAILFDLQRRYADAGALQREILDRRRRVLGEDHPETLASMNNLANIDSVEGRHAEADAMLRDVLERQRRLLGEKHPDTVNTLYNLGCNAALSGDRRAALDWLRQAVEGGWEYADQMATDSDLEILKGDPAFHALVARARANAGKASPAAPAPGSNP